MVHGRLEGPGEYFCRSGDYYKGEFLDGWQGGAGERGETGPGPCPLPAVLPFESQWDPTASGSTHVENLSSPLLYKCRMSSPCMHMSDPLLCMSDLSHPGTGWRTYGNGDVWFGAFEAGVPHGAGTLRFADGDSMPAVAEHGCFTGAHQAAPRPDPCSIRLNIR